MTLSFIKFSQLNDIYNAVVIIPDIAKIKTSRLTFKIAAQRTGNGK